MTLTKQLKEIMQGWGNSFLDKLNMLPTIIKEEAEERSKICSTCPIRTDNTCDPNKKGISAKGRAFYGCGCYIDKKVLCMDCDCPGEYWKAFDVNKIK